MEVDKGDHEKRNSSSEKKKPDKMCACDFSSQGFFAICFPGFLIEFYANKSYLMFQLLEFYMMSKNHFCKLKWSTTFQNEVCVVNYLLILVPFACVLIMGKDRYRKKKRQMSLFEKLLKKIETFLTLNFLAISYTNQSSFFLHKLYKHDDKHIRWKKSVNSYSMKQNSANAHLLKFYLPEIFFWTLIESLLWCLM